jgi:protein-tyrosine phosphatase
MAIMPRPRGGDWLEDELRAWRNAGVDIVVSLLETDEVKGFDLSAEEGLARADRIEFVSFPIADRGVPESQDAASVLVTKLVSGLRESKNIAIHCRQGIGRSAMIAIAVLIRLGVNAETAIGLVCAARGCIVPETREQRAWLLEFARRDATSIPA